MRFACINIESEIEYKIPAEIKDLKVGLVSTSQYMHQLEGLKKEFKNSIVAGQVLGCNASNALNIQEEVDIYYFLGEGRFHPLEIAWKTKKPVYISNGDKISEEEINNYNKKRQGHRTKFHMAETIGILVTTKPGQNRDQEAIKLMQDIKSKTEKKAYILIDNTFNIDSLEDFNNIDIFINTACPRLEHNKVIPMDLIQNELKEINN
jgi:2-(3-amino-3-carboxypropyl)histidine synthase